MTVQCINCRHFSLRDAGEMAKLGFGRCAFGKPYEFVGASCERECAMSAPADPAAIAQRTAWCDKARIDFRTGVLES